MLTCLIVSPVLFRNLVPVCLLLLYFLSLFCFPPFRSLTRLWLGHLCHHSMSDTVSYLIPAPRVLMLGLLQMLNPMSVCLFIPRINSSKIVRCIKTTIFIPG